MTDITQLGYPAGFLGLDDNQSQSNPNANNLGNIRPTGSNTGFKQTPSKEQGLADIDANLLAYGQKHGIDTLRGVISRWAPASENDTGSYINTVAKRLSLDPDQKIDLTDPAIRHLIGTGIILQEKGPQAIYGAKSQSQQIASDSPFALPQDTSEYKPFKPTATKPATNQPIAQPTTLQGAKQDITEFYQKNKMTPEEFEKQSLLSPLTKTLVGVSTGNVGLVKNAIQDYVAKSEAGVRGIGDLITNVYEHPKEVLKQIKEHPAEIATGLVKGVIYNPTLNPLALKPTAGAVEGLAANVARAPKIEKAATVIAPEVEKLTQATSTDTPTYLRKKFAEKQGVAEPIVQPVAEQPALSLEDQTSAQQANIPVVIENPPERTSPITDAEKALREKEMRDIGITTVRKSALIDNPKETSSQFITSQSDQGPYGSQMTDLFNHEKKALDTHFKSLEEKLGGSVVEPGSFQQEEQKIAAGHNIKKGINAGFENWKTETDNLYKQAKETHGDKPVELNTFNEVFSKPENFTYGKENELKNSIKLVLERKNLLNDDGTVKPMTVKDSEEIRQLINKKYHYEVSNISSEMKNAIDNDVFSQVGGEVYQKARSHFGEGKDIYENPKAMNDLLGDKGVNEKWTDEQVIAKVNALPQKQFNHLFSTLVRDGQTDSINQIKTSLINQIRQAGKSGENMPFNSIASSNQAAKLGLKLKTVFADDPATMEEVLKGLRVAKYTHVPTRYPGAAVQTHLLKNKLLETGIQKAGAGAGAGIGAFLGGPMGAGIGAGVGESGGTKLASLVKANRQAKQFKKEIKENK